jgi:hypothetical protein
MQSISSHKAERSAFAGIGMLLHSYSAIILHIFAAVIQGYLGTKKSDGETAAFLRSGIWEACYLASIFLANFSRTSSEALLGRTKVRAWAVQPVTQAGSRPS